MNMPMDRWIDPSLIRGPVSNKPNVNVIGIGLASSADAKRPRQRPKVGHVSTETFYDFGTGLDKVVLSLTHGGVCTLTIDDAIEGENSVLYRVAHDGQRMMLKVPRLDIDGLPLKDGLEGLYRERLTAPIMNGEPYIGNVLAIAGFGRLFFPYTSRRRSVQSGSDSAAIDVIQAMMLDEKSGDVVDDKQPVASGSIPFNMYPEIPGITLDRWIKKHGPYIRLMPREQEWYALQMGHIIHCVLNALDWYEVRGIVHQDLKPTNIIIDDSKDPIEAVVIDLGLAKSNAIIRHRLGFPRNSMPGTPYYQSPELIQHGYTLCASDIWALGIIVYEMLKGERPFQAGTRAELMHKIVTEELPNIWRTIPEPFIDLLYTATQKDTFQRADILSLSECVYDIFSLYRQDRRYNLPNNGVSFGYSIGSDLSDIGFDY